MRNLIILRLLLMYRLFWKKSRAMMPFLRNKSFSSECTAELLAKKFKGFSCAKIESVINKACMIAAASSDGTISLKTVEEAMLQM